MRRALIVVPGRGSYGRETLGYLNDRSPAAASVVADCDAHRAAKGRPTVTEIDASPSFRGSLHVAGEHASLLTFACALADLQELDRERFEVVGVCGNSMGWYGALAAAGALPIDHAIELVETMGAYQAGNVIGGQVIYPLRDADGRPDPTLRNAIDAALRTARERGEGAWWSIDLGSHAVLGADADGVRTLLATLPRVERGARAFPAQLPLHSAFHTPLLAETAERAARELAHLRFSAPQVPLIDGRGTIHRPRWADPESLRRYTLGAQVVDTYDFALGLRTALQHCGPDVVVLLGPGNSLGGPAARQLLDAGWRGVQSRADLDAVQASEAPALLSFGVRPQRAHLVGS